ncbi:hypothetical protein F4782DRAFT_496935 [Xylaria castorea]|nr:hypothetical protein F4782DRAFT_496935 [Xylaria castorea]
MAVAPTLSLDLLLSIANHLGARDLLHLGATQQSLKQPLTHRAFKVALTGVPFDHDLQPVTYAIKNGDIQLFSKTVGLLDSTFPAGWDWPRFYGKGVGRLLTLAAAHNLESLQHLVQKYPLIPGPSHEVPVQADLVPAPVPGLGFYVVGNSHSPAIRNIRNWELVIEALKRDRYDSASFLLNYQPPLFPNGFPLNAHPACFSSLTTLNFLIDHGADLGVNPLHYIAETDPRDPQVFDILVERGLGIDSPLETFRHSPIGLIFTPLNKACQFAQPRSVEALLRLGANPNGTTSSFFISQVSSWNGFHYSSPLPILTLLLSSRWDPGVLFGVGLQDIGRRLIDCFQLLIHYGATTSIPLLNDAFIEIVMLRIWRCLFRQIITQLNFVFPEVPDKPQDLNQGVQSILVALNHVDVSPWDNVCQVFSDLIPIPMWSSDAGQTRGKERLIRLLSDYQNKYGDLPGQLQLGQSVLLELPDRYITTEYDA